MALTAVAAALASTAAASPALAGIKKEMAIFSQCPINNPAVIQCVYSTTTGGEFHLGSKTVPVNKTIVLQGGLKSGSTELVPPLNGETLSRTPLQLPGGLVGVELLPPLTEVNATAEPAGTINVNVGAEGSGQGTAVSMPLKVHLENPLLGGTCVVGSDSEPIVLQLTTGTTSPPPPNSPITGNPGTIVIKTAGKVNEVAGSSLVDNAFAAPGVNGCDEPLSLVVDPSVDLVAGLPSAAGNNTAILNGSFLAAAAWVVRSEAALPEIGRCVKAPSEKVEGTIIHLGHYFDSGCTFELNQGGGKFEWEPGTGANKTFTTEAKASTLETVGLKKLTCTESHGSGEYTGTKTATFNMTFTGCVRTSTKEPCQSSGSPAGTITAPGLAAQLGFIKDQAIGPEQVVSLGWNLAHEPSVLSAECGSSKEAVLVTGSVIGPLGSFDKMLGSYVVKLKQKAGLQEPEAFEEEPKQVLSATFGSGSAEQAGLTSAVKVVNGEKLEIKGLVE